MGTVGGSAVCFACLARGRRVRDHACAALVCCLLLIQVTIQEVLPKAGLVYSEKGNLSEVMCKPKIMALKSVTLERLEAMEREAKAVPGVAGPGFGVSSSSASSGGRR